MKLGVAPDIWTLFTPPPPFSASGYWFRKLSFAVPLVAKSKTPKSFLPRMRTVIPLKLSAPIDTRMWQNFSFQKPTAATSQCMSNLNNDFFSNANTNTSLTTFLRVILFSFSLLLLLSPWQERRLDTCIFMLFLQSWVNKCLKSEVWISDWGCLRQRRVNDEINRVALGE